MGNTVLDSTRLDSTINEHGIGHDLRFRVARLSSWYELAGLISLINCFKLVVLVLFRCNMKIVFHHRIIMLLNLLAVQSRELVERSKYLLSRK